MNKMKRHIQLSLICLLTIVLIPWYALGEFNWQTSNASTEYAAIIDDEAELLSQSDIKRVAVSMIGITEFCNVGFYTYAGEDKTDVVAKARNWGNNIFGSSEYTIFMIDMAIRRIGIYSRNNTYQIITSAEANNITDRIYQYASEGQYSDCAQKAFEMMLELLLQNYDKEQNYWIPAENAEINDDIINLCTSALSDMPAQYTPITYLGYKALSGSYHAILCQVSDASTGTTGTTGWAIVFLDEGTEGNASIMKIVNLDLDELFGL